MLPNMAKISFSDVIKLRALRWRNYPILVGWALNVITSVPVRGRQE